jgi:hypothetical protein
MALHSHRNVPEASDENDRHVDPIHNASLYIETVEIGKMNVEYEATRSSNTSWASEEFLRGFECLGLPALTADQQFQ